MANECINVYMNNPTAGQKDGTCVSNGTFTAPIKFEFARTKEGGVNAMQKLTLAIRTEEGFKTVGKTTIRVNDPVGARAHLSWQEDDGGYPEISTTDEITDTNKLFYISAVAHTGIELEDAGRDTSMSLEVIYLIKKV